MPMAGAIGTQCVNKTYGLTVSTVVAETVPEVAEIVVVVGEATLKAVASPVASIVAVLVSDEAQVAELLMSWVDPSDR
jgi:hypothetical protein